MSESPLRRALVAILLSTLPVLADAQQRFPSVAVNRAYIDTTCSPCKDFFRFANGAWLDSATVPPDRSDTGPADLGPARNRLILREILDSLAYAPARHARTVSDRNVGHYFRSCMDSTATAEEERRPLLPELRRIDAIRSRSDVSAAIGRLQRQGMSPLFWFVVINDYYDPTLLIPEIRSLWGWAMPSREAYTAPDSASARIRAAYVTMLTEVYTVLGDDARTAGSNARLVLQLETAIVRAHPRDSGAVNNKRSVTELQQLAPAFDWRAFAVGLGRPDLPPINLRPQAVASAIDGLIAAQPLEAWRAYLRWTYVRGVAPATRRAFGGSIGTFMGLATGRTASPPRAVQCVNGTTNLLGDAVAQAYVARVFSPRDRTASVAMVEGMRGVLRDQLRTLAWIDPSTRSRAVAKLDSMRLWIGYPDRWEDDSGLALTSGPAAEAFLTLRRHRRDKAIAILGGRTDRDRWSEANAAFADAAYYATSNALLITAGYLQPPFYDPLADDAANFGAVGFTIGHELTHGFDSNGRLYNEIGMREDWWTVEDAREFERRSELVVRQYDAFVVIDSIRQNGRKTLGENISDIGGLTIAYLAFKRATAARAAGPVDGLTPDQRFFIAFAQSTFRRLTRPEQLRLLAETDSHSAPQWRINGALMNLDAFAAAFGCKAGDPMVLPPHLRGNLWLNPVP